MAQDRVSEHTIRRDSIVLPGSLNFLFSRTEGWGRVVVPSLCLAEMPHDALNERMSRCHIQNIWNVQRRISFLNFWHVMVSAALLMWFISRRVPCFCGLHLIKAQWAATLEPSALRCSVGKVESLVICKLQHYIKPLLTVKHTWVFKVLIGLELILESTNIYIHL